MASAPFLVPIDLNNLEIQNVKLQNISTGDPTVGVGEGSIFMDSTAHRPKWHDGSAFQSIWPFSVTDDGKAVLRDANGDFTAGTITADLTGNASTATTSTNLAGGSAGKLPYQTGAGATSFTAAGTASQVLLSGGTGSPTWSNQSALSVGSATTATTSTNLAGGTVGQIPYQSGAGATTFLSAGTAGQLLTSGGAASPTWTTKSDIKLSDLGSPSANLDLNGWKITNVGDPTGAQDAATKAYVDAKAQGLDIKDSCVAATTDVLPSYVATGSVDTAGAYLEASANGDFPTIFSFVGTPVVGNRVLVKNETSTLAKWNGIYTITALGGIASKWKLTRAADFDAGTATSGSFVFVEEGASPNNYKGTGWVMNQTGTISINSTAITWTQFSGAGTYSANRGLVLNTTTNSFNFAQDSNYTAGQIPFASSTTAIGFNANLHWDNSNNRLGIGTATPGTTLHVVGTGSKIRISTNATDSGTIDLSADSSSAIINAKTYATAVPLKFQIDDSDKLTISNTGVFTWSNVVNAGTAMVLDGTGLGIGTASPAYKLDVTDTNVRIRAKASSTGKALSQLQNDSGSCYFGLDDSTGSTFGVGNYAAVCWNAANSPLVLATNNVSRLTIDSSGNVGIGEASAGAKLHVKASTNIATALFTSSAATTYIQLDNTNANGWGSNIAFLTGGSTAGYFGTIGSLLGSTDQDLAVYSTASKGFRVYTNGNNLRMLVDSSGNVGINQPIPAYKLDVNGNANFTGNYVSFNGYGYIRTDAANWFTFQAGTSGYQWRNSSNGATAQMVLDSSGNVGIATTPSAWGSNYRALEISGAVNVFGNTGDGNVAGFAANVYNNNSGYFYRYATFATLYLQDNGQHQWHIAPAGTVNNPIGFTQAMTLDASGNLVLGAASATEKLDVAGAGTTRIAIRDTTGTGIGLFKASGDNVYLDNKSASGSLIVQTGNGGTRLTISSTGAATFTGDVTVNGTGYVKNGTANTSQIARTYNATLSATSNTEFTVNHNLGTRSVMVQVRQVASPYATVVTDVERTDSDNVKIKFASNVTGSDYNVVVLG